MEKKAFFEIKEDQDPVNERDITGYPVVMGNLDDGQDVIHVGATVKTVRENGHRIKWLWSHDPSQPPTATIKEIQEVRRDALPVKLLERYPEVTGAVRVKRTYLDTPRGNEILVGIKEGAVTESSVGYDAKDYDFTGADGGIVSRDGYKRLLSKAAVIARNLRGIRVWEFSDVVWGMNSATSNAKSIQHLAELDITDNTMQFNPIAAKERLYTYCSITNESIDWKRLSSYFLIVDGEPDDIGSYKYPIADVVDGQVKAVPQAITTLGQLFSYPLAALVDLDEQGIEQGRKQLEPFYVKINRIPHWQLKDKGILLPVEFMLSRTQQLQDGTAAKTSEVEALTSAYGALRQFVMEAGLAESDEQVERMFPFLANQNLLPAAVSEGTKSAGPVIEPSTEETPMIINFDELAAQLSIATLKLRLIKE